MNPSDDSANAHSSLQRQCSSRSHTTTHTHRYLAHRSCNHAIAITPSPSRPSQSQPRHHYLAHCSCDHVIAISPSQSQSHNQPFATSGVTTPVATARSPIARSLVVSIYSDHWSIPMPILVLALTQLIKDTVLVPTYPLNHLHCLSLLCSPCSPPNAQSHYEHSGRNLQLRPLPTHVCKRIHRLSCWCSQTNHGR
jgi:hypothetical protein